MTAHIKNNNTLKFTLLGKTTIVNTKSLHSRFPSLNLSHTPSPVWGKETTLAREEGEVGAASRVMSVDTCQKYSLCPEKSCVWCDSSLPALNPGPYCSMTLSSWEKNSSCVHPPGEREQDRTSRQGQFHTWIKYYDFNETVWFSGQPSQDDTTMECTCMYVHVRYALMGWTGTNERWSFL